MLTVNLNKRDLVNLLICVGGPEGGIMDATYYVSPYESGWNVEVLYGISDLNLWLLYESCLELDEELNALFKNTPRNWQKKKKSILMKHKSKMVSIVNTSEKKALGR